MFEIKNLKVAEGGGEGLSLQVRGGQVAAVVGGTEDARRQLQSILMGLKRPAAGFLSIGGEPFTRSSAEYYRRRMAWLPTDYRISHQTVAGLFKMLTETEAVDEVITRQALAEEWQLLGVPADSFGAKTDELDPATLQRVMFSFVGVLKRRICILGDPASMQPQAFWPMIAAYIERLTKRGAAVLMVQKDMRALPQGAAIIKFNE